jgi:hypothetical protein
VPVASILSGGHCDFVGDGHLVSPFRSSIYAPIRAGSQHLSALIGATLFRFGGKMETIKYYWAAFIAHIDAHPRLWAIIICALVVLWLFT